MIVINSLFRFPLCNSTGPKVPNASKAALRTALSSSDKAPEIAMAASGVDSRESADIAVMRTPGSESFLLSLGDDCLLLFMGVLGELVVDLTDELVV